MGSGGWTLDEISIKYPNEESEQLDQKKGRGKSEYPEGNEGESRNKSESSLTLDNLTIQCHASSVDFDVFSTEVIVPTTIKQNLLSESDIEIKVVVVDGGDDGNPPIHPPVGVNWHCLSVIGGNHLHVQDETDPCRGLTFARVDGTLPFI